MERFFISDLHFGHKNCLTFDSRPFADIDEHDAELCRRWNSTVSDGDEVWIIGDVSWLPPARTKEILSRLNGEKHLIIGNHDKKIIRDDDCRSVFAEVTPYHELKICKGMGLVLCHYPIPCFNHRFGGWYHLYGHVHKSFEWTVAENDRRTFEQLDQKCNMINVGCMMPYMDYTPRTLEQIIEGYDRFRNGEL